MVQVQWNGLEAKIFRGLLSLRQDGAKTGHLQIHKGKHNFLGSTITFALLNTTVLAPVLKTLFSLSFHHSNLLIVAGILFLHPYILRLCSARESV